MVSQLVMLVLAPVLTRLYLPSEFGAYSLFISITSVVGLVSSLKYDQAIMLARLDKDANAIFLLSLSITSLTTILSAIAIIVLQSFNIKEVNDISDMVWYIPIGIFLIGALQILNSYLSRKQNYKGIATTRMINSLSMMSVQIGGKNIATAEQLIQKKLHTSVHLSFERFDWLILGKIFADSLSLLILLKNISITTPLKSIKASASRLKANAKKHYYFPRYQSLTVLSNAISQNLPVFLLAGLYSVEIAGLYALTVRVLKAPINLIGASTKEVYYQRASKMYISKENIYPLYIKTTKSLIKLFIAPLFLVLFFGEELYGFAFGDNWKTSGALSQILVFWYFFGFINAPSIATFSIISKQNIQMATEIFTLAMCLLAIYGGYYFSNSYYISILAYVFINVISNVFLIIYIYKTLRINDVNNV